MQRESMREKNWVWKLWSKRDDLVINNFSPKLIHPFDFAFWFFFWICVLGASKKHHMKGYLAHLVHCFTCTLSTSNPAFAARKLGFVDGTNKLLSRGLIYLIGGLDFGATALPCQTVHDFPPDLYPTYYPTEFFSNIGFRPLIVRNFISTVSADVLIGLNISHRHQIKHILALLNPDFFSILNPSVKSPNLTTFSSTLTWISTEGRNPLSRCHPFLVPAKNPIHYILPLLQAARVMQDILDVFHWSPGKPRTPWNSPWKEWNTSCRRRWKRRWSGGFAASISTIFLIFLRLSVRKRLQSSVRRYE